MIAAVGARVEGRAEGAAAVNVIPTPPDGSAAALVDLVRVTPAPDETLLLVRDCGNGAVQRAADVAAAVMRDQGVVVRAVAAPPTRFAALVTVLDEFTPWLPVGALVPALPFVDATLSTVALVDSVAQLESPPPSLADHAASHLPGSRFLVLADRVVRGGRPQSYVAGGGGRCFAAASRDAAAQEWRRELLESIRCPQVMTVWDQAPSWWGARKWAEVTTPSEPVGPLLDRIAAALPVAACRWCGRPGATTSPCCFCGAGAGSQHGRQPFHPGVPS